MDWILPAQSLCPPDTSAWTYSLLLTSWYSLEFAGELHVHTTTLGKVQVLSTTWTVTHSPAPAAYTEPFTSVAGFFLRRMFLLPQWLVAKSLPCPTGIPLTFVAHTTGLGHQVSSSDSSYCHQIHHAVPE